MESDAECCSGSRDDTKWSQCSSCSGRNSPNFRFRGECVAQIAAYFSVVELCIPILDKKLVSNRLPKENNVTFLLGFRLLDTFTFCGERSKMQAICKFHFKVVRYGNIAKITRLLTIIILLALNFG